MVLSLNRGTPVEAPKCYNHCYRDLQKGTPNFGQPGLVCGSRFGVPGLGLRGLKGLFSKGRPKGYVVLFGGVMMVSWLGINDIVPKVEFYTQDEFGG